MIRPGKLAALLLLLALPAAAQESCRIPERLEAAPCARAEESRGRPGDFDFYILSLSWSPAFCASDAAGRRHPGQCRDNTFGWVVHGLWPQYARGRNQKQQPWPQYCAAVQPVAPPLLRQHFCRLPDAQLMQCQWAKHGSCGDFPAAGDYFAAIARLAARFVLPTPESDTMPATALRTAILAAHPGLQSGHVQVIRRDGAIREVRICLDRALDRTVDCRG